MNKLGQHHKSWLLLVEADLERVDCTRLDERDRLLSVCDAVLQECPDNETTMGIRARIESTFSRQPESSKSEENSSEFEGRIIEAIEPYGNVVYERVPEVPDRMCVLVKRYHGSLRMFPHIVQQPEYGRQYIQHQNEILDLQRSVGDATGRHMHIFLEGLMVNYENLLFDQLRMQIQNQGRSTIEEREGEYRAAAESAEYAYVILSRIQALLTIGKIKEAQDMFETIDGEQRCIASHLMEGADVNRILHGILTERRLNKGLEMRRENRVLLTQQESYDDYVDLHRTLSKNIAEVTKKGEAAFVVLGGGHFKYGIKPHKDEEEKPADLFDPVRLESTLEQTADLDDAHIVVVEPHNYNDLLAYHEESIIDM